MLDKLAAHRLTEKYLSTKEEIRKLQPMRIGIFKRYWDKFKYNKTRRENLIEAFDDADEQVEFYLEGDYRNWRDEIPGARDFIREMTKKKVDVVVTGEVLGNTVVRTIPGEHDLINVQEVQYSPKTFNPFHNDNIKVQEKKKVLKLYIENDMLDGSSDKAGLTLKSLGLGPTDQSIEGDKE